MEELRKIFVQYLDKLTIKERDVIRLIYGFEDGKIRSRKEVSELFGTTVEDITEELISALTKMPNFWETFQKADKNDWEMRRRELLKNCKQDGYYDFEKYFT